MRQLFTLKTIMLACLLCVGMGAWAEDVINNSSTSSKLGNTATSSWVDAFDLTLSSGAVVNVKSMGTKSTSNALQWNANGYLYMKTSGGKLKSVTIKGASKTVNVYASNTAYSAAPSGTALGTISVTSEGATYNFTSDYAYIALKGTASSTSITEITIEYQAGVPYTVTFNAGTNGTCSTTSLTEASAGAGVTLPDVTANTGYRFEGWSTSATPSSADAGKAGATYKPSSNSTLYAYYVPVHTAQFSINGTITPGNNCIAANGDAITFPSDPEVDDVTFMGWATAAIVGTQNDAPAFVNTATETMGNADVIYYAVFATESGEPAAETKTQTLQYDTWTYSGSTTDKSTYRLFHSDSYIESASFDRSKLTKVVVYGGTFGGASYNSLTIGDGTNTWKSVTVSGSSQTGENTYTDGTALSGTGSIRITSNSGSASSNGVRISKVEIYTMEGGYTYSDYCTTVALDPKPTLVLSATELAEYAGNTNTSITASVSEGAYTGALTVASSADAVATASISEGTITINALTAGTATITVTAPAVSGFRKATATIAVTVSEKLAHGLAFDAATLNLTVGDTEFTEPTLSNPNSLPVVYSLVYAKPENEGKVATINAETGKLTLADPSLSTETQGAVTVKASTVGDNSHAAGEVTYNLVVARKVATTSWSNSGAAVNIDQDEIATLPTASNSAGRNISYESSNTDVATIDETGAVTFVAYGTTTITAKTSATAEYAATNATYELTFAPRYTVKFNVNGNVTEIREETSGAGVTAPAVEPIAGKVFRGWAENTIDGTTNDAPAFVNASSLSTLDQNMTLYAVFATLIGNAEITYTKLESNSFDNSAEYVLAAEETSDVSTLHYFSSYTGTSANESWGVTSTDADDAIIFSLSGTANALIAQDASGNYLEALATGKFKMSSESTTVKLDNGKIYNPSSTYYSYNLRYNHNNGSGGFRWYANTTGTSAYFYKKEGGATYSDYCTTVPPSSVNVDMSAYGYATFSAPYALDLSNMTVGYSAYVATASTGETVTIESVSGVVPANTGLIIKGTKGTCEIPVSAEAGTTPATNYLVAVTANNTSIAYEENVSKYVLGVDNEEVKFLQIVKGTPASLNAGKSYLKIESTPAKALRFVVGGTTGIENVASAKSTSKAVKRIMNGQLIIEKAGKMYNAAGAEMK